MIYGYLIKIEPSFCKNIKYCANCIESFSDNNEYKCKLFYNLDIITGQKYFYTCKTARMQKNLCGLDAKYYFYNTIFDQNQNSEPSSNN